jgi:SAM-dependent methyltransferase
MKQAFRQALPRLEEEHWWYRARRRILERAISRLVDPVERCLSVGVGVAREAEMLSHHGRLIAIDREEIDPTCTEWALATRAEATDLPFQDGVFDAVFIFDVLEHIERESHALREIHRVLAPGGALLVTVPAFMFLFGHQDVVSNHKRRYRRSELVKLLDAHRFDVRYSTYFNTVLFPLIATIRLGRRFFRIDRGGGAGDFDMRITRRLETVLERAFAVERHAIHRIRLPFGVSVLCFARRADS